MLRVRKVEPGDRELLEKAAVAHQLTEGMGYSGEAWSNGSTIIYEDENGPVVAIMNESVVRIDVQFFAPQQKIRNAKVLIEGFYTYMGILQKRGVKEVIFNTGAEDLAKFFKKRFRFRQVSEGTFSLWIGD